MNIMQGEIIEVENREYVVFSKIKDDNDLYLLLVSNDKEALIKIAKVLNDNVDDIDLEIIENEKEKKRIIDLYI